MEANNIQIIHNYVKTSSLSSTTPPQTIKMEDLTTTTSPSTPDTSFLDVPLDTPRSTESRQVKKRKSWGQVLPEPKTNLPPRKRAKTADEKEQRRIERVKRNRLAAHNSRERKRQEVELLQIRNAELEQRLKAMEEQLTTYRTLFPQADVPALPKFKMEFKLEPILDDVSEVNSPADMDTPAPTSQPFESPDSLLSTLDSPIDTAPSTPGTEMMMVDGTDRTQHSAAMLCKDLQCQSVSIPSTSSTAAPPTPASFLSALVSMILFNFQILARTATLTPSSTSTSSQTAPNNSLARIPSSRRASMARRLTSADSTAAITRPTLWSNLMAASSICSPAQARLLQSATHRALRRRALALRQLRLASASGSASGMTPKETLTRDVFRQQRRASHSRRVVLRNSRFDSCNTSLAWDIKRSARVIRRQLS